MDNYFSKDPGELLDYTINWAAWLGSDTITSSSWSVPSGLTNAGSSFTNSTTTVWLSGGTDDQIYTVTNTIQTAAGRIGVESIKIRIERQ